MRFSRSFLVLSWISEDFRVAMGVPGGGSTDSLFRAFLSLGPCWGPNASPRVPRTTPGLHFCLFFGAFGPDFGDVSTPYMPKSVEKKMQKRTSIPCCFSPFLGDTTPDTVQNCHRALQATGAPVVPMGTVAGRPKAIGYKSEQIR